MTERQADRLRFETTGILGTLPDPGSPRTTRSMNVSSPTSANQPPGSPGRGGRGGRGRRGNGTRSRGNTNVIPGSPLRIAHSVSAFTNNNIDARRFIMRSNQLISLQNIPAWEQLLSMLTPMDIISLARATIFCLQPTERQRNIYMPWWRQIFYNIKFVQQNLFLVFGKDLVLLKTAIRGWRYVGAHNIKLLVYARVSIHLPRDERDALYSTLIGSVGASYMSHRNYNSLPLIDTQAVQAWILFFDALTNDSDLDDPDLDYSDLEDSDLDEPHHDHSDLEDSNLDDPDYNFTNHDFTYHDFRSHDFTGHDSGDDFILNDSDDSDDDFTDAIYLELWSTYLCCIPPRIWFVDLRKPDSTNVLNKNDRVSLGNENTLEGSVGLESLYPMKGEPRLRLGFVY